MSRLILVDPRPEDAPGCELCPTCKRWKKVRLTRAGGLVKHTHNGATCPGSGHVDTDTYVVETAGPPYRSRSTCIGRDQAEIIANADRRKGRDVFVYLEIT